MKGLFSWINKKSVVIILALLTAIISLSSFSTYALFYNEKSFSFALSVVNSRLDSYPLVFSTDTTLAETFYAKSSRNSSSIIFDFLTFGDFAKDGKTGLEFVNIYLDLPNFNTAQTNWRLNAEDATVRVYSDGSVYLFTQYTGIKDNIWFKLNRNDFVNGTYRTNGEKAYEKGERLNDVVITRSNGETSFKVTIPNGKLGITGMHSFRFFLAECSDASTVDFHLYSEKISLWKQPLSSQLYCTNWTVKTGKGDIRSYAQGILTTLPSIDTNADYFETFVKKSGDNFVFDFSTNGSFGNGATGKEFINLYIDMPPLNTSTTNWTFKSEDVNVRIYSDGSVYLFTEFNGSNDNTWFKMDYTNYANGISGKFAKGEKLSNVTISRVGGITQFSVVLPYDKLGITADDEIRFYLKECADNGNDYALYAGNLTVNGVDMGDPVWANNWAIMLADGTVRYLGENAISFSNYISSKIEKFEANVSASNGVVTFDFLTYGVFGESGTTEFINLFLDMPALNTSTTNWTFKTEDVNIRIYSDGSVYLMTEFNGSADNLWWKMDFTNYSNGIYRNGQKVISSATKLEDVTISRENNKTQFSLSVSLERLGNASASSFRVYMEECCENGGNDYGMYADGYMAYKGRAVTGNHLCQNWPTFTVATNAITF